MQYTFIIKYLPFFILSHISVFSQRYTIYNGDTIIVDKNIYKIEGTDTLYTMPCYTFELKNNKIINFQDNNCLKQGIWHFYDEKKKLYAEGYYKNSIKEGVWIYYRDSLMQDTVLKILFNKGEEIKRIEYTTNNKTREIVTKNYSQQIFERFWILALIILLILFYLRAIINNQIYNKLERTDISIFIVNPFNLKKIIRLFKSMFTLYWSRKIVQERTDLKLMLYTSNILVIILIVFFITVFLFAIFTDSGFA